MPVIPIGAILTVDVLQVGSSVAGSDIAIQVVGEVVASDGGLVALTETLGRIPRYNIRPQVSKYRASKDQANKDLASTAQKLNDLTDIMAERIDTIDGRVASLDQEYRHYNAVLSGAQFVAADLVPWTQVSVAGWRPIKAWVSAKTAPVGADLIVDVKFSVDAETTLDAPVWESIFPSGSGLALTDGTNRRTVAWSSFA